MKLTCTLVTAMVILFQSCKNDVCSTLKCMNGGTPVNCFCKCPPGFSGNRCEIKDTCTVDLGCKNLADCTGDSCLCQPTFYGKKCDSSKILGKTYVVKNLYLYPINFNQQIMLPVSNFRRVRSTDYIKNFDNLTTSRIIYSEKQKFGSHVQLFFTCIRNAYDFYAITPDSLKNDDRETPNPGYTDNFTARWYNGGDSIHMQITRDSSGRVTDIMHYDLIKK